MEYELLKKLEKYEDIYQGYLDAQISFPFKNFIKNKLTDEEIEQLIELIKSKKYESN